jgi:y4mF family transcriptional regulator
MFLIGNIFVNTQEFGNIIREARRRQGLRQDQLAAAANVGLRFIVDLEAGKETAQIGKVLGVARALGLTLSLNERPHRP